MEVKMESRQLQEEQQVRRGWSVNMLIALSHTGYRSLTPARTAANEVMPAKTNTASP